MKNKAGFTIMELMVAIAIVSILSAIAIPNIISWRQNRTYVTSLQRTLAVMHSTKAHSVKENVPAVVRFDLDDQNFRAFVDNNFDSAWTPGTDRQIDFYEMPPGVKMTSAAFGLDGGDSFVRFDQRGMPNVEIGKEGLVELTSDKGPSNDVRVNMTGRIRISG